MQRQELAMEALCLRNRQCVMEGVPMNIRRDVRVLSLPLGKGIIRVSLLMPQRCLKGSMCVPEFG